MVAMRYCLLLMIICSTQVFSKVYVTYEFTGGRFGDDLISYLHAKWFEFNYGYKLLYKPFPFSDKLHLHIVEEKYNSKIHKHLKLIRYTGQNQLDEINLEGLDKDVLLLLPFYPESNLAKKNWNFPVEINPDWKNKEFRDFSLSFLKPRKCLNLVSIPKKHKSIALHLRTGIGFDDIEALTKNWPSHCLPLEFFVIQIKQILQLYPANTSFYCHIFTDHPKPTILKKELEAHFLEQENLIIGCNNSQKQRADFWNDNLLEDFFSLFSFDCLVRPDSHFSILPSLLKDFDVLIYPDSNVYKNQSDYFFNPIIESKNN